MGTHPPKYTMLQDLTSSRKKSLKVFQTLMGILGSDEAKENYKIIGRWSANLFVHTLTVSLFLTQYLKKGVENLKEQMKPEEPQKDLE